MFISEFVTKIDLRIQSFAINVIINRISRRAEARQDNNYYLYAGLVGTL